MSINDELTARATKLRVAVADVAARSSRHGRHGTAPSALTSMDHRVDVGDTPRPVRDLRC